MALVVLDPDVMAQWASQNGVENDGVALAADERVQAEVARGVEEGNGQLSRVEQIKRFTILEQDWLPGGDELTPTMKLKRKPIAREVRGGDRGAVRTLTCGRTGGRAGRRPHPLRRRRRPGPP